MSPLKRTPSIKSKGRTRRRRGFGLSATVQVNLTPQEKAFIEKKAAEEGVTLSQYFAMAALTLPTRRNMRQTDKPRKKTVQAKLKKNPSRK
jgi:hypothetical protein